MSISANINDNFSVSYEEETSNPDYVTAASANYELESTGIQAAYTMGGMTLAIAMNDHENVQYSNAKDVLLGKTNTLTKAENYDRFELDNVIAWWKKLATKRYDKMIAEGKVRKELEVWNSSTMNKIDIIR